MRQEDRGLWLYLCQVRKQGLARATSQHVPVAPGHKLLILFFQHLQRGQHEMESCHHVSLYRQGLIEDVSGGLSVLSTKTNQIYQYERNMKIWRGDQYANCMRLYNVSDQQSGRFTKIGRFYISDIVCQYTRYRIFSEMVQNGHHSLTELLIMIG